MGDQGDIKKTSVQADGQSIAIGSIDIGGDVSGDITIGHAIGYTSEQVSALLTQISATFQPKAFDGRCPYKGLDFFEEVDAELFFGREKLVDDLVKRVKESRTVFITGPSGSGKSSLVRAGLLYALKRGDIKDANSESWLYVTLKPGREPFEALALAFSRLKSPELAKYFRENLNNPDVIQQCAESALSDNRSQRLVLFIDQFEEVFTQLSAEKADAFIQLITNAAGAENGRVILLFAMRSDFVSNCATYSDLNALLNKQFVQIGAMQSDELVSAIAQPALRVGLRIDPDLISQIIEDMQGEPGALPLMQFALKDLFEAEKAKGGLIALTHEVYLQRGGIQKSLERYANDSFGKLDKQEQELARSIFGGLVEIGHGTQDTRRTALFDELIPASASAGAVKAIVRKLTDARLITTDEQAGKDTVTIAHEKLIDAWPWLKKLVNENRDVIALQNNIASDAKEWENNKRDPSYLYTGARLINAREQLESKNLVLSGLAHLFIETGVKAHVDELEAAKEREIQLQRRALILTIALGVAVVAVVIAIFFGIQSQHQSKLARVGELAAITINLREKQPVLSLLMGIETFRLKDSYRTRSVLIDNLNLNPQVLQYFSGQSNILESVAFSPDGRILASGGYNNEITLWDVQTHQTIGVLQSEQPSIVRSITFSPDGQTLASGNDDKTIILWNLENLKPIGLPFVGHLNIVRSVSFSPDGEILASGSADNTIMLWDVQTHQSIGQPFVGHSDAIYSISFSPDGKTIASGSVDQTVILWDAQTHQQIGQPLVGHSDWVKSVAFSPNGSLLASGSVDKTIILWDVKTHQQIGKALANHSEEVRSVAFSPDGKVLASGSADKTIILWDVHTHNPIGPPFTGHTERVVSIAFNPDGKFLASGGDDGLTILWNVKPHLPMGQFLAGHENSVTSLDFSPSGEMLASASNDQSIIIWDSQTRQQIGDPIISISERVTSVAFSPDGNTLAAGYADGTILIWDVMVHQPIGIPLIHHHNNITSIAFSPDGKKLASASLDETIILWDIKTHRPIGQPLVGHSIAVWGISFSPDGKALASGGADHKIIVWDLQTQKPRGAPLVGHSSRVNSVAFSPDGKYLVSGSFDSTIIVWDLQTQEPVGVPLLGHLSPVYSVAFSPDGKTIASGSEDNTIILWDYLTYQPIGEPLKGHSNSVISLTFSPDNKSLASGDIEGTIILWNLTPESWIQKTCLRAGRNFTKNEWTQYFADEEYSATCVQWPSGN